MPISGTKYKRSNSIFFVINFVLICACGCMQLLQPFVQSLIVSPGTSPAPDKDAQGRKARKERSRFAHAGDLLLYAKHTCTHAHTHTWAHTHEHSNRTHTHNSVPVPVLYSQFQFFTLNLQNSDKTKRSGAQQCAYNYSYTYVCVFECVHLRENI